MKTRAVVGRGIGTLAAIILGALLNTAAAAAQNVAPEISGVPPPTVIVGQRYDFRPTAIDANGDALWFRVSGLPRWARFERRTGRVYGSPGRRDVGTSRVITISASDGQATTALPGFTVQVVASAPTTTEPPANEAPSISGTPVTHVVEQELYGFLPTASDPNGDTLKFSIVNRPSWATFTSSTGLLSGIPPAGSAGTYGNVQISVTDGQATTLLTPFSVTVQAPANRPPTISGTPSTSVQSGQQYSFRPTASDPDGQVLRFSIMNQPDWAAFDVATGALTGTPATTDVGTYSNVVLSATDGSATATLAPFAVTVTATNTAPTITGSAPTSATVGQAYAFAPSATDPDGQRLTFSIANRPAWTQFDAATGQLSGTPATTDVGTFSNVVISVTDGQATSSLNAFSILVRSATTGAATISWSPPTANVDASPLTNLAGYRILYGLSSTSLTQQVDIPNAGITSALIEGLAGGTWYFAVRAYNTANVMSDPSSTVTKVVN